MLQERWTLVLQLLDEMQAQKLEPNEVISATVVSACAQRSPELSIDLFECLKNQGVRQNKFGYTAALGASEAEEIARGICLKLSGVMWTSIFGLGLCWSLMTYIES